MKVATISLILLLTGCATCHEHPVMCSAAGAFVVASVAISVQRDHDNRAAPTSQPTCAPNCPVSQ